MEWAARGRQWICGGQGGPSRIYAGPAAPAEGSGRAVLATAGGGRGLAFSAGPFPATCHAGPSLRARVGPPTSARSVHPPICFGHIDEWHVVLANSFQEIAFGI